MTRGGTGADALAEHDATPAGESPEGRKRRVRVRVKRKQDKFPRWVRVMLWVGLPVTLWVAIYLIGTAILRG